MIFLFCSLTVKAGSPPLVKEGDIIFQQSQSSQAPAVAEATNSVWTHVGIVIKKSERWYVAEARGPLQITPLQDFIRRSNQGAYKVVRFRYFQPQTMTAALYKAIYSYNQPYDVYFEFSDERIYCSELVYKVFKQVTGHGVGEVVQMKELNLNGPYVQKLIKDRLTSIGKELNLEEPIVTPISQMVDANVTLIQEFVR